MDEADGWIDRAEVRSKLDDLLAPPDPESWGTGPAAEEGIQAMLAMTS